MRQVVTLIVLFTVPNIECVPGTKSLRQCYKYNDIRISLRDLDSYKQPSKDDLEEIRKEEAREDIDAFPRENPPPDYSSNSTGLSVPSQFIAVGGVNARPFTYKFMAALGYGNEANKEYLCGGTLISDEYVLTAAHCLFSPGSGIVKYIRLGDTNIASTYDDVTVEEFKMSEYHIHPNYSFELKYHDIALIKLDKQVNFTNAIRPICLEHERRSLKYQELFATGWGLLGYGESPSDILQEVRLKQYTHLSCQKTYGSDPKLTMGFIDDHQICAGTIINITDTCEGDSGGPLVYFSKRNGPPLYYLVGITSFGVPCGVSELPAVYTRVSYYIDWIESIVWPKD